MTHNLESFFGGEGVRNSITTGKHLWDHPAQVDFSPTGRKRGGQ
jgi:hypothetical protein